MDAPARELLAPGMPAAGWYRIRRPRLVLAGDQRPLAPRQTAHGTANG